MKLARIYYSHFGHILTVGAAALMNIRSIKHSCPEYMHKFLNTLAALTRTKGTSSASTSLTNTPSFKMWTQLLLLSKASIAIASPAVILTRLSFTSPCALLFKKMLNSSFKTPPVTPILSLASVSRARKLRISIPSF